MASLTRWTWVWVNSGSWWWTGRPGMLWFMESQSQTGLSYWTELNWKFFLASLVAQRVKHLPGNEEYLGSVPGSGRSLEMEMAMHSSTLAWKMPWTDEPGRLQSMGSQRVLHDWATSLYLDSQIEKLNLNFCFRASLVAQLVKNPPTMWETWVWSLGWEDPMEKGKAPVFWPGKFHGLYSPWGCKAHD